MILYYYNDVCVILEKVEVCLATLKELELL